jgi:methionyl-tRNA formyltransferase
MDFRHPSVFTTPEWLDAGDTMRIAFLGTPEFSVPTLRGLLAAGHEIACVYSQPAKPRARGQAVRPSPVEAFAIKNQLMVRTPVSMKEPVEIAFFENLDLDVAVVVAFGQILVRDVLEAPRFGCLNLHASLLPRWRGAAPIQRAIMAGDKISGVQVMRMTEGLDEGPVLMGEQTRIDALETASSLHDRLSAIGEHLAPKALEALASGTFEARPQSQDGIIYARKIKTSEAAIDWSLPSTTLDCQIRGLSSFPGAWTTVMRHGQAVRLKILLCLPEEGEGVPGTLLDDNLLVACGSGALRLLKVQREGKAVQDAAAFLNGNPVRAGERLV